MTFVIKWTWLIIIIFYYLIQIFISLNKTNFKSSGWKRKNKIKKFQKWQRMILEEQGNILTKYENRWLKQRRNQ